MTIQLPEEWQRYVDDQVQAGRFRSEDDVILDALRRHREGEPPASPFPAVADPVLGSMREDAELLDDIVEQAMRNRRDRPGRLPADA